MTRKKCESVEVEEKSHWRSKLDGRSSELNRETRGSTTMVKTIGKQIRGSDGVCRGSKNVL